jgi:hypothetical protein
VATYGTFVNGVSLKADEANDFFTWTTFSPVVTQSNTPSLGGVVIARYAMVNKLVFVNFSATITGTGTSNNSIQFTLPVTASSSSIRVVGSAIFRDFSNSNDFILGIPVLSSTTACRFLSNTSTSMTTYIGLTNGPNLVLSPDDSISVRLMYEAA